MKRTTPVVLAVAATCVVLAGCGPSSGMPSSSASDDTTVPAADSSMSLGASSDSEGMTMGDSPSADDSMGDMSMDDSNSSDHTAGEHEHHDMTAGSGALTAEQDGFGLALVSSSVPKSDNALIEFTIFGPDGEPVRKFDTVHEKKMHVILVSDDLTEYHHIHPEMSKEGVWSSALPLASDRSYRMVADFVPTGADNVAVGETFVVGSGSSAAPSLTENRIAEVDGYRAELVGDTLHEDSAPLKVEITNGGNPVTEVKPYLGAAAHFVAFSDADMSYYHMHPNSTTIGSDGAITFTAPPMGHAMYKGFVQVDVGGSVKTFEFTWRGE